METKYVRVPFDLELAKKITNKEVEGRVITRKGYKAKILTFNMDNVDYPICATVTIGVEEDCIHFAVSGAHYKKFNPPSDFDLMLEIPEYMTFKDGDIATLGWKIEDEEYCEWITILKEIEVDKYNILTEDYVTVCLRCDAENYFTIDFDCTSDGAKWVRKPTELERQRLIDALKESKEPKAKEYLKRFFGIEVKENKETEFKFGQLVLVRNDTSTKWLPAEFGFDNGDGCIVTIGGLNFRYCIPYEGNEHLLGTKENVDEKTIVKNKDVLKIDEIKKAAKKAALVEYDLKLINEAEYRVAKRFFELGANWFRTLAWKNSNEMPETSKLLLIESKDGGVSLCKFSKDNTDTSKWKRWMYVKYLIPCLED